MHLTQRTLDGTREHLSKYWTRIHYFINIKLFWRDNFVVVCLLLGCDWSHKGFCICDIRIPSDIVIWKSLQVYRHFLISFPFWTCFCICPLLQLKGSGQKRPNWHFAFFFSFVLKSGWLFACYPILLRK